MAWCDYNYHLQCLFGSYSRTMPREFGSDCASAVLARVDERRREQQGAEGVGDRARQVYLGLSFGRPPITDSVAGAHP